MAKTLIEDFIVSFPPNDNSEADQARKLQMRKQEYIAFHSELTTCDVETRNSEYYKLTGDE